MLRANSCVLQLPGLCFPGSALNSIGFPPIKQPLALEAEASRFLGGPKKMGQEKGDNSVMSYLNSITLVGFVGSDPEQHQAKANGAKFTVMSVATQRSWKNAEDEWPSKVEWHRIAIYRPRLAEFVARKSRRARTCSPEDAPGLVGRSFRAFGNHRLQNDGRPVLTYVKWGLNPVSSHLIGRTKYGRFRFRQACESGNHRILTSEAKSVLADDG
jgi:hypothetical protein